MKHSTIYTTTRVLAFLALILTIGMGSLTAQIISEDFQGGSIPTNWTVLDVDASTVQSGYQTIWPPAGGSPWTVLGETATNDAAASTSWFATAGAADDWLITPQFAVTANTVLEWRAMAQQAAPFNDGYEVRISTGTPTVANFTANAALFSTAGETSGSWVTRTVNLASYANSNVYIAFRNNSNDKNILWIDDVEVFNAVAFDASIGSPANMGGEYNFIPEGQTRPFTLEAEITNRGSSTIDSVTMKVNVYDFPTFAAGGAPLYTATSMPVATITAGNAATLNVPGYTATDTGFFVAEYIAGIKSTQMDGSPANDTVYESFTITDSTFVRDNNVFINGVGIGPGVSYGLLGNMYDLVNPDALTSMSFFLPSPSPGQTVQGTVLAFDAMGVPDTTKLGVTVPYILQPGDTNNVFLTLEMQGGPLPLNAAQYVFAIIERDSLVSIGRSPEIYTPGTSWIYWDANGWATMNSFGPNFEGTLIIRPNFGPACAPFGLSATTNSANCGASDGSATVSAATAGNYSYSWSNGATTATATGLAAGSYTVTVTDMTSMCTDMITVVIGNVNAPTITSTPVTNVSCPGGMNGTAGAVASGGTGTLSYMWSTGGTTANITGLAAGTYTVTVTDMNNCQTSSTVTVTQPDSVNANPTVTDVLCNGDMNGSIALNPSGGTPGYNYAWSTGGMGSAILNVGAGSYSVTIADGNNCVSMFNIDVNEPAVLTGAVSMTPDDGTGSGTATVLPAGGTAPYNVLWSTGSTSNFLTGLSGGTYTVTVTDANNCTVTEMITVTTTSIEDELAIGLNTFELFPNPSQGQFTMKLEMAERTDLTVQLFDQKGRAILQQGYRAVEVMNREFDIRHLPAGVYLLQVSTEKGAASKRIILE